MFCVSPSRCLRLCHQFAYSRSAGDGQSGRAARQTSRQVTRQTRFIGTMYHTGSYWLRHYWLKKAVFSKYVQVLLTKGKTFRASIV